MKTDNAPWFKLFVTRDYSTKAPFLPQSLTIIFYQVWVNYFMVLIIFSDFDQFKNLAKNLTKKSSSNPGLEITFGYFQA